MQWRGNRQVLHTSVLCWGPVVSRYSDILDRIQVVCPVQLCTCGCRHDMSAMASGYQLGGVAQKGNQDAHEHIVKTSCASLHGQQKERWLQAQQHSTADQQRRFICATCKHRPQTARQSYTAPGRITFLCHWPISLGRSLRFLPLLISISLGIS